MFASNINWLTQEAHQLHNYFVSMFYVLITALLSFSVIVEYFKFPLGQMPSFGVLVGRALIAMLLLVSYTELANTIAAISDEMTNDLGNLDKLDGVLRKMGEKVDEYSVEWLNARSLIITAVSVLTYAFLFYAVIIAEVAHLFTWTVLYVFSPLLIALFVVPATAGATKALYRSLVEVAFWKVVFAVLSSLLWASVLIELDNGGAMDFLTMIGINLILGGSLIATPWIVHALAESGLSGFTRNFSGLSTAFGFMTPQRAIYDAKKVGSVGKKTYKVGSNMTQRSATVGTQAALFAKNPVRNSSVVLKSAKASGSKKLDAIKEKLIPKKIPSPPNLGKNDLGKGQILTEKKKALPPTSWQKYNAKVAQKREIRRVKKHNPSHQNS